MKDIKQKWERFKEKHEKRKQYIKADDIEQMELSMPTENYYEAILKDGRTVSFIIENTGWRMRYKIKDILTPN